MSSDPTTTDTPGADPTKPDTIVPHIIEHLESVVGGLDRPPHLLPAREGWDEIADHALEWALAHAVTRPRDVAAADS